MIATGHADSTQLTMIIVTLPKMVVDLWDIKVVLELFKKYQMKNLNILKPLMLPILQAMISLVLFSQTANVVFGTYVLFSLGLIFILIDLNKTVLKNLIEITSISILFMVIGFFLPDASKVLVLRYFGITVLSVLLLYVIKKYSLFYEAKKNMSK